MKNISKPTPVENLSNGDEFLMPDTLGDVCLHIVKEVTVGNPCLIEGTYYKSGSEHPFTIRSLNTDIIHIITF